MSFAVTPLVGFGGRRAAAPFPTVVTTNTSTGASSSSHTVSLPTGIVSGNLLIAFCALNDDRTHTWPAGWTELTDADTGNIVASVAYRVADGSEGSTISVSLGGGSSTSAHITLRITNYTGTPEAGTPVGGTSTTPDPPSVSPSWGSDEILVLAFASSRTSSVASAAPSGYGNLITVANGSNPAAACARLEVTASSENPGTFTLPGSVEWQAQTICIRGA